MKTVSLIIQSSMPYHYVTQKVGRCQQQPFLRVQQVKEQKQSPLASRHSMWKVFLSDRAIPDRALGIDLRLLAHNLSVMSHEVFELMIICLQITIRNDDLKSGDLERHITIIIIIIVVHLTGVSKQARNSVTRFGEIPPLW